MTENEEAGIPRFALPGRAYVYFLSSRDEDVLKVGFSRDPLQRMHALHRRYFDFFDLDRSLLIEVDKVVDARRIERLFIQRFAEQRAPAPLVIRKAAAGETEWFRGVGQQAEAFARATAETEGWTLHAPLSAWLRQYFREQGDGIYTWAERMLEVIEYERFNPTAEAKSGHLEQPLRHLLDGIAALDMNLADWVPAHVLDWYHRRSRDR